ncbi:MAG: hypothetical protein DI586_05455 [Micavibrio aeruginosavorus]|uniref:Uncharacterized protein n=1 Tax=Micavibrio aeruginosavorus TaxID=349221 RepID=A0A2W5FL52_9BACT|nr:MAG: hypothetical protein DI586_05455 [Micavibrio aeruginosavorus]
MNTMAPASDFTIVAQPVKFTFENPHFPIDDKVDNLIGKISASASACLVNMHLEDFTRDLTRESLKASPGDVLKITQAVSARTEKALGDPDLHSSFKELWSAWKTQGFPYRLDRIPVRQAASFAAMPATLAP